MRVSSVFAAAIAVVLLSVGGLGVVSVRPRFDAESVERALAEAIGGESRVREVSWSFASGASVDLIGVEHRRSVAGLGDFEVRAPSVLAVPGLPSDSWLFSTVTARDLEANLGGIRLVHGRAVLTSLEEGLQLAARARGRHGGGVELDGRLPLDGAGELRAYLSELTFPVSDVATDASLRLEGTLVARDVRQGDARIVLHAQAHGERPGRAERWLDVEIDGDLRVHAGRWLEGSRIEGKGVLHRVQGARELHAIHGNVGFALGISGDLAEPSAELVARLRDVRLRLGDAFDKPAGRSGELRLSGRVRDGRLTTVRGSLELARRRLDVRSADGETWTLSSSWLPLDELAEHVPLAHKLPPGLRGSARLRADWSPSGARGRVEFRNVELPLGDRRVSLRRGAIDFAPGKAHLSAPGLRLGRERIDVHLDYFAAADKGRPSRVRAFGAAETLDLDELARVLEPLLGAPQVDPTLETVLTPVVYELRNRPRLLAGLELEPSFLRVARLTGLGLDRDHAVIRLALRDRRLELTCGVAEGKGGPSDARSVVVEFDGWAPRIRAGSDGGGEVATR